MHNLQCDHCGYLNPLKSEYVIFCEKCQKKITNNFKDWQRRFPDKTLIDFKAEVCIPETVIAEAIEQKKQKRKGLTPATMLLILLVSVVVALGSYFIDSYLGQVTRQLKQGIVPGMSASAPSTGEWVTFQSKEGGFQALFPAQPTASKQTIDTEVGKIDFNLQMYQAALGQDENMVYGTAYSDYPPMVSSQTLDAASLNMFYEKGISSTLSAIQGELLSASDANYGTYRGKEVKASLQGGAALLTLRMFLVNSRLYMQQVVTIGQNGDNASAKRFFESFQVL